MIIVKITGGLGNQLFQYSFGRYLSMKFESEVKYDIQTNYDSSNISNRNVGLSNFNIHLKIATNYEIYKFKFFKNTIFARIERKMVQKIPILNRNLFVQKFKTKRNSAIQYYDNCYYDGYWQSENYFKEISSILKSELVSNFNPILSTDSSIILEKIRKSNSVSVHIRRGDYISNKPNRKIFFNCPLKYYETSINYVTTRISDPIYFLFSDDIEWINKMFIGEQYRIVSNNFNSPEVDLFLMCNCKHNIIANSSFSWWGAWLNQHPEKIVIAPKQWYKGKYKDKSKDLIPPEWIQI